ncbi:MAG: PEGA domain-containing protein [Muribaculaceae bacterium]|nr:PEGA domain-containing protein [Muribaculaceae bacterium]
MNIFKTSLLVLALSGSLPTMAQKLETRDFKATNELTARLKDSELIDENSGKRAALIKIYTPFQNELLGFDAGLFQVLGRRQAAPGEVWLYVPERTQKITITHPKYSPTVLWLDGMEAESGKTYSVVLNVEGRDVSLIASAANADISVDGEPQGKSPVNMHMPLGSHLVRAELGSLLFEDIVTLTRDGETNFNLPMEDENLKYGDVDIEVANGAELWFQDKRESIGSLKKHLRAGSYVVTAKLPDHEDQVTTFSVEAGQKKTIQATPPVPHLGYLSIVTEPENGVTVTQADTVIDLQPTMQLPVARYEYAFSKRGYYPQVRKFRIERGETLRDTVIMKKIQYVKKNTGYAAVSFVASGKPSVGFTLGGYIYNVNLEIGYNLGLGRSEDVEWYDRENNLFEGKYNYRMDEMMVKVGYQLRFAERFGLTPQAGFMIQRLWANDKSEPGNGFTQPCATAGARLSYHPVPHVGFFLTPEYAIPVSTKGDVESVFSQADLKRGGFRASIGISVSL